MVIVLVPTRIGRAAVFHEVVPAAVPVLPSESVQVTFTTPTLSEAVPLKTMDAL